MDSGQVEVRVRQQDETEAVGRFTLWQIDDLDRLINLMNRWGNSRDNGNACGQFACDDGQNWYFEIIVGDEY